MPLVNMKMLLKEAKNSKYAVGSFSVANMEMIMGAVKAAEELSSPIILQVAEARLKSSPLHLIGPMIIKAAENASVPVAAHFDHGLTIDGIKMALELGFTSVMFDGSALSIDKNIELTNLVEGISKPFGASVEAEIGTVGGSEDNSEDIEMKVTNIEEAIKFSNSTNVDALAIAIGNAHGVYKGTPKLRFDILEKLNKTMNIPLVLHGGTGISHEDFRRCAQNGISKINIATATFKAVEKSVKEFYNKGCVKDYFDLNTAEVMGAYENIKEHIEVFGSNNRI